MKRIASQLVGVLAGIWIGLVAFPSTVIAQGPPAGLFARVAALEAQMSAVQAENGTQAAQIAALQADNGTQSAQIAALQAASGTQAGQIAALQAGIVPVGTIITYSSETPPPGYLECDGTPLSRTAYPNLFAAIGTAFGSGDGSSTFHIPDLRGQFLRGWAHGTPRGMDPDRNVRFPWNVGGVSGDHVGSYQSAAFAAHAHSVYSGALNPFGSFSTVAGGNSVDFGAPGSFGLTTNNGGSETRPWNVAVMYAIKY